MFFVHFVGSQLNRFIEKQIDGYTTEYVKETKIFLNKIRQNSYFISNVSDRPIVNVYGGTTLVDKNLYMNGIKSAFDSCVLNCETFTFLL